MKKLIATSVLCLSTGFVSANEPYASVAYSMLDSEFSFQGESFDSEPTAINIIGGVSINESFALEALVGLGLSDDDIDSFDAEFELDSLYGIYAVGALPVSDNFNLYAKFGVVNINFEDVDSDKYDGSGISYGLGAEARINEKFGAALEYVIYPDAELSRYDVDVETAAINLRFNVYF